MPILASIANNEHGDRRKADGDANGRQHVIGRVIEKVRSRVLPLAFLCCRFLSRRPGPTPFSSMNSIKRRRPVAPPTSRKATRLDL